MKPYYERAGMSIYLGDCRDVLPSLSGDIIATDPPYGIGVRYGVYADDRASYWDWFLPVLATMRVTAPRVVFTHQVASLAHIAGWDHVGVWHKPFYHGSRLGNSCVIPQWEPIYLFGIHKIGTKSKGRYDVFSHNVERTGLHSSIGRRAWQELNTKIHPCPKPLSLYLDLLATFGQGCRTVIDPFMGSGTTLLAAKMLGFSAVGIEVEERYCEIAANRLSQDQLFETSEVAPVMTQDAMFAEVLL
jgi:hypothetical protein